MKCKLWIHTFSETRKVVIRRKKNLLLETLMPEGSEITYEKSRDINRKPAPSSSEIQLEKQHYTK